MASACHSPTLAVSKHVLLQIHDPNTRRVFSRRREWHAFTEATGPPNNRWTSKKLSSFRFLELENEHQHTFSKTCPIFLSQVVSFERCQPRQPTWVVFAKELKPSVKFCIGFFTWWKCVFSFHRTLTQSVSSKKNDFRCTPRSVKCEVSSGKQMKSVIFRWRDLNGLPLQWDLRLWDLPGFPGQVGWDSCQWQQ